LYLRRVHSYCFYCGEEYDDERTLAAKCGPAHLRNTTRLPRVKMDTTAVWSISKQFEDKYLRAADERIAKGPREIVPPTDDPMLVQMKEQYVSKKITVVTEGSIYKCGNCDKKFKTSDFVFKHFLNKHSDVLDEKFNKVRFEGMMAENYHNDPKKMVNQPGFGTGPGGFGGRDGGNFRGGFPDRGGRGGFRGGRGDGGRSYHDYDDPSRYQAQI
jgi:DNA-directed RNA polymerase subunit RPC12/RpoP